MKVKIVTLCLCLLSSSSFAGWNGLTHHSRANCGNNESVSWDWTANHLGNVATTHSHYDQRRDHGFDTGWVNTWRIAAVHWAEANPGSGWVVLGTHRLKDVYGNIYIAAMETVVDCAIYDGWWDKDKPYTNNKVEMSHV